MASTVTYISIQQFCAYHNCDTVLIEEFIDHGIINPDSHGGIRTIPDRAVARTERALRLHDELGVNSAGIDIILNLLDRLERQRFTAIDDLD